MSIEKEKDYVEWFSSVLSYPSSSPTIETERIDVCASEIRINSLYRGFGPITGYHLYIVYTDRGGKEYFYQGLPFDPKTGQASPFSPSMLFLNPPGLLTRGYRTISQWRRRRNQLDIANTLSVTVLTGAKASEKHFCLEEQTLLFNAANIPYRMTVGPNSNTYVRTILERCDIPAKKPESAMPTPGWDLSVALHK